MVIIIQAFGIGAFVGALFDQALFTGSFAARYIIFLRLGYRVTGGISVIGPVLSRISAV